MLTNYSSLTALLLLAFMAGTIKFNTVKAQSLNIKIKDGKVEIGFMAHGTANSFCYVDDVILLKKCNNAC